MQISNSVFFKKLILLFFTYSYVFLYSVPKIEVFIGVDVPTASPISTHYSSTYSEKGGKSKNVAADIYNPA